MASQINHFNKTGPKASYHPYRATGDSFRMVEARQLNIHLSANITGVTMHRYTASVDLMVKDIS